MIRRVVRIDEILQDVDIAPGVLKREISVHFRLQRSVESFYHGSFDVFVFRRVKMDAVTFQHTLKRTVHKLCSLVRLKHVTFVTRC